MQDHFTITYQFAFPDGERTSFALPLGRNNLSLLCPPGDPPPAWAALANHQCRVCPFQADTTPNCPIAHNLAGIVAQFNLRFSYQSVDVTVTTEARTYVKNTSLQEGLSSLLGIIMVTSGCRPMERLKPLVRFHLPFATLEETTFRTISLHLITQYLRKARGLPAEFSLEGLDSIYADVAEVNNAFAKRLREAAQKDANINALVNLHCFAEMVPLNAADMLGGIEESFTALLEADHP